MFLHVGPVLGVGWAGEAPFNIDVPGQCQCVSPGPVDSGHQLIRQLEKSSVNFGSIETLIADSDILFD